MKRDKLLTYLLEYENSINALFEKNESNNINVVVYGSYNTGKSSLLNSIVGSFDNEFFPTNDVPETRENKIFKKGEINFIDTPGIDVNYADDKSANAGATKADIIIFVHKLTAGSIQQQDLNAFKRIFALQANSNSVLFVLTAGEIASKNAAIIDEIRNLVSSQLSRNIEIFIVSNSVYKKGILEKKPKLVEFSGMQFLLDKIEKLAKSTLVNIKERRANRKKIQINRLLKNIREKQDVNKKALSEITKLECEANLFFVRKVKALQDLVKTKIFEIKSI